MRVAAANGALPARFDVVLAMRWRPLGADCPKGCRRGHLFSKRRYERERAVSCGRAGLGHVQDGPLCCQLN
jgi:hypothetical protein